MPYHTNNKKKKVVKKKTKKTKKNNMEEHALHHSKKHIRVMKKFMSGGMSMNNAHSLATRMVGK